MNLYDFLQMEDGRHQNEDPDAPRKLRIVRVPIFHWRTKPKPDEDPTAFDVRGLLIPASDAWDKKVLFRHPTFSMREASRNNGLLFSTDPK